MVDVRGALVFAAFTQLFCTRFGLSQSRQPKPKTIGLANGCSMRSRKIYERQRMKHPRRTLRHHNGGSRRHRSIRRHFQMGIGKSVEVPSSAIRVS